ncbi:MAG: hypothetical protein ABJA78_13130 [Ferruginibacter sp.]
MKKIILSFSAMLFIATTFSQAKKTELYDLIKKLTLDSNSTSTGDWAVGHPNTWPVQWENDKVTMSDDMDINFFRKGTATISLNGNSFDNGGKSAKWMIMLKGARSGYSSYTITSPALQGLHAKEALDSLFGKRSFTYKLLQRCDASANAGFYYYEVHLPKKAIVFMKTGWSCSNGNCSISIDCYDDWSKQYAKLNCK